eukprot:14347818-Alexandrium_andersonii.AAC.1
MVRSQVKCGDTGADKFSLKDLTGKGLPGGKGLIDLWLAKRELADVIMRQAKDMKREAGMIAIMKRWVDGAD